jgi:predicted transposase YbfD/YdcC
VSFPHCGQVGKIQRQAKIVSTGVQRSETVYFITSLTPDQASPEQLLALARNHWSIENRSHYVRDVSYDEDRSRVRTGAGPRMMAILRNLAIALLRHLGFLWIPEGIRHFSRRTSELLTALGL